MEDPRLQWEDEVGSTNSIESGTNRVKIPKVTKNDLSTGLLKCLRTLIVPMNQRSYGVTTLQQQLHCCFSGRASRSRDQTFA